MTSHSDLPNALTVDLEDWYHSVLEVEPSDWPRHEDRVVPATERLLGCLAERGARATFFVLGHVAERHPELVPAIEAAGHEIACHGYAHRLVYTQSPDEFRDDLRRSLDLLRTQAKGPIRGYRAAYWSITRACPWALDVLADEGLAYDSSIYPTRTSLYGVPDAPRAPFRLRTPGDRELVEFPPSVLRFPVRNLPFAGGIYLRLLPYAFVRWAMRRFRRAGRPALVYIHPPEFDPGKPRLALPFGSRVLHYARLDAFRVKVPRLLAEFAFGTLGELFDRCAADASLPTWSLARDTH
ncbi:MAG TPA: XrtA system polysaccharide deacetylase [Planctomycetota bacterium]|nr:XrtA system polysaccharide deacetylase [Planctomycetota bacterium]